MNAETTQVRQWELGDSARGQFLGFAVYVSGEAIGKVYEQYKHAVLLLEQVRAELDEIDLEERRVA